MGEGCVCFDESIGIGVRGVESGRYGFVADNEE